MYLGVLQQSLGEYIKQVLVLKADQQTDRRSSSSSFRRVRNNPNLEVSVAEGSGVTRVRGYF